ncbi:MAG: hydroxide adenosyltransferase [Candidatus Altiarchaeales archaeon]|nr:hydroxide adenosyltransferase [Candidatus Altiarchaeales archaeon]MBD3417201.1 hydroxide adenosyltransferase [Candidatus Altiarchaeales archaeon]
MYVNNQFITLTTDFGPGYYVAEMKGVIKRVNDKAEVFDVAHNVSRYNIVEGAFILSRVWRHYPRNTVHVGVVDPRVGSERKALAVETEYCTFIGPDNGLLRWALKDQQTIRAISLDSDVIKTRAGLDGVSATFHGRDVFAPAAALITKGVDVDTLGMRLEDIEKLEVEEDRVIYVDGFGDIVTTITKEIPLGSKVKVLHGGERHDAVCVEKFSDAEPGELIVLNGSHGLVEVDVNQGNAAERLGAKSGDEIRIENAG